MKYRAALRESLEEYAGRFSPPLPADRVRVTWRLQGLRQLHAVDPLASFESLVPLCCGDGPRVAPGVAVPCAGITPADVVEVD